MIDSDELNAFACGGHLVVVTSFAIEELTARELSGVLAHELSHHLGLHTAALTLGHWLSLPVLLLARFGFFLQNVARAATDDVHVAFGGADHARSAASAAMLTAVSWVFLAALYASDALSNAVGRSAEFEADRRAVRMGYGKPLADALRAGDPARRRRAARSGGGRGSRRRTPRRAPAWPASKRCSATRHASARPDDVGDRGVEDADQVAGATPMSRPRLPPLT